MDTKLNSVAATTSRIGPAGKPVLDTGKMSARCIFATDALDRVGDILNIQGIDVAAYLKNPVVLFDHGKWFGDPIGRTVDPQGKSTLEFGEHEAAQTTFFFPTQLGEQYYSLVAMGGLNTNSIGYRTLKARKNNAGGKFLDSVELVELSWVGVPANAECVRAFLAKDKIEGKALHPSLRAALEAQLPAKTTVVTGGFVMKALTAKKKSLMKAAITAAKKELPPEEVKEETPAPVAETPPETPAPVEEAPAPATPAKLPLGAEMLSSAHSHMAEWIEYCNENLDLVENEDVKTTLLALCEETIESMATVADLYSAQYPDLEPLPEIDTPEEESEPEETEEPAEGEEEAKGDKEAEEEPAEEGEVEGKNPALIGAVARVAAPAVIGAVAGGGEDKGHPGKSYSGEVKRLTKAMGGVIKECAEHLTEMKDAENLTSAQKLVCRHYSKELGSMVEEKEQAVTAEGVTEDKGDDSIDEIEKEYDAMSPDEQKAFDAELAAWVVEQEHEQRLATAHARRNRR